MLLDKERVHVVKDKKFEGSSRLATHLISLGLLLQGHCLIEGPERTHKAKNPHDSLSGTETL